MKARPVKELITPGATYRDGSNFWRELLKKIQIDNVSSPREFLHLTGQLEAEYKRLNGGHMPEKYRSAKSVVEKAFRLGVPLFDESGRPRSKNAVVALCKAAQNAV